MWQPFPIGDLFSQHGHAERCKKCSTRIWSSLNVLNHHSVINFWMLWSRGKEKLWQWRHISGSGVYRISGTQSWLFGIIDAIKSVLIMTPNGTRKWWAMKLIKRLGIKPYEKWRNLECSAWRRHAKFLLLISCSTTSQGDHMHPFPRTHPEF